VGRLPLVIALTAATGCYHKLAEKPCAVYCDNGMCPLPLTCGEDGVCHGQGDGCSPDAAVADGPSDAMADAAHDAAIPDDAPSPPKLVQSNTAASSGTTTSFTGSLVNTPISGHVIIMIGANNGSFIDTPTGGGVTSWMKADQSSICANTEIWFGVTNGSSKSVTITCSTCGSPPGYSWMWLGEWSGLDTASLLDKHIAHGYNSASNTTPGPGSIMTANQRELVLLSASLYTTSPITIADPSWIALTGTGAGGDKQAEWYQLTTAIGTFNPTVGPSNNCWDTVIASFRAL
jgi:hypothetical protein